MRVGTFVFVTLTLPSDNYRDDFIGSNNRSRLCPERASPRFFLNQITLRHPQLRVGYSKSVLRIWLMSNCKLDRPGYLRLTLHPVRRLRTVRLAPG